ncbi:serine/threonine protein kinase [Saprolegnia parasitica CBS 223.65]|uniref:Serine/threonine protein kinase n=1 Tax=Saprolegnia parasitica (strain CBS 223.65) TaxID=695850 RepID=A0A067C308_SAPPC|nr:serine/threonine protein kinase [Saprolegnia parasitica CBS 223.65]KDO25149.1 serine/threonine protein kinase [Saprolegnia parasitica CBS 223.65]|eukprot:XP_012204217.1 serine/threonine protein kinase [Saprolegnia parasitica CBS 223.65]
MTSPYVSTDNDSLLELYHFLYIALGILVAGILFGCLYRRGQRVAKTDRAAADDYLISSLTSNELETLQMLQLDASSLVVSDAKPIASGAFGDVWRATYLATNATVVIKRTKDRRPEAIHAFIQEILLLAKLQSPYIVTLLGVTWRRLLDIEAVLEHMQAGDLRSYLANSGRHAIPWAEKALVLQSIVYGLVFLHTLTPVVIHRDLKSRNVLLDASGGAKLTDFGVSRELCDSRTLTNGIGTFQWMAPEVINGSSYTEAADIYSFGVIVSEMSTHEVPYTQRCFSSQSAQSLLTKVASGDLRPDFDATSPRWVHKVGARCLAWDPRLRPTTLELTVLVRQFVDSLSD